MLNIFGIGYPLKPCPCRIHVGPYVLRKSPGVIFLALLLLFKHAVPDTLLGLVLKVKEKSKRYCDDGYDGNNSISFY